MRKAMGYVCLLAVMFALGIPQANAEDCTVKVVTYNETGADVDLPKIVVRRVGSNYSWHSLVKRSMKLKLDKDAHLPLFKTFRFDCTKNYKARVIFKCENKNQETTITTNNKTGPDNGDLRVEVRLKQSHC